MLRLAGLEPLHTLPNEGLGVGERTGRLRQPGPHRIDDRLQEHLAYLLAEALEKSGIKRAAVRTISTAPEMSKPS